MRPKPLRDQYQNWCIHFTGIHQDVCKAGIRYTSVRDSDQHPFAWPCIQDSHAATSCELCRYPTDAEAAEHEREMSAHIDAFLSKLANDICPDCNTPVERQRQVGRCVYAEPCGHRLFQGKAKQPR
jgi:hypothetical protein